MREFKESLDGEDEPRREGEDEERPALQDRVSADRQPLFTNASSTTRDATSRSDAAACVASARARA